MDIENIPSNPVPKKAFRYGVLVTGFIALLLGIIGTGIVYWQTVSNLPASFQLPVHKEWPKYTNYQYNFEFSYPPNAGLTVRESSSYDPATQKHTPADWLQISLVNDSNTTAIVLEVNADKVFAWGKGCDVVEKSSEKLIIQGIEYTKRTRSIVSGECTAMTRVEYNFSNLGDSFVLSGIVDNDLSGEKFPAFAQKILSSFKFTK